MVTPLDALQKWFHLRDEVEQRTIDLPFGVTVLDKYPTSILIDAKQQPLKNALNKCSLALDELVDACAQEWPPHRYIYPQVHDMAWADERALAYREMEGEW